MSQTQALKILIAGDQVVHERPFFESVARRLCGDHTVFLLTRELEPVFKGTTSEGVIKYGIGRHEDKFRYVAEGADEL